MGQIQVILSEDVHALGDAGEVVTVKPGYARNFLIPQGKALIATAERVNEVEHKRRVINEKLAKELKDVTAVKSKLDGTVLEIAAQAGEEGQALRVRHRPESGRPVGRKGPRSRPPQDPALRGDQDSRRAHGIDPAAKRRRRRVQGHSHRGLIGWAHDALVPASMLAGCCFRLPSMDGRPNEIVTPARSTPSGGFDERASLVSWSVFGLDGVLDSNAAPTSIAGWYARVSRARPSLRVIESFGGDL